MAAPSFMDSSYELFSFSVLHLKQTFMVESTNILCQWNRVQINPFKDNFGYFPCATFLWWEMGPVIRPFTISDQYSLQKLLCQCQMDISTFSGQNKVTIMCLKYLFTRYYK